MAAAWRIISPRQKTIRKGARYCLPAVAVIGLMSWVNISLSSSPRTCICASDVERQKQVANAARLFPISVAESQWKSLQSNTTKKKGNRKQVSPTKPPRRSFKHKTTLITTETCAQYYFLLVLVSSAPSNVQRRRDIRQTWGVDYAMKPRWKTAFLVAQTRNKSESDSLLKEDEIFGDLVRAGYYEHYSNQTLKIQMAFEWAATYCNFSFLLKIDDDSFANTKALISLLKLPSTPHEKLYMGRDANSVVLRTGKFGVSKEEYSGNRYPSFCPGFGIVLSADVVRSFVDLFDIIPKFRFDDVYIGMLANKAGVEPTRNNNFEFTTHPSPQTRCKFQESTLVRHAVTGECLFQLFKETYFN